MPISPYFTKTETLDADQLLHEDLINEQINLRGINVYYILRETMSEVDLVFGEDPSSIFQSAYLIAALPVNVDSWTNGDSMFSKFGLYMNKSTEIVIAKREFRYFLNNIRLKPTEGDLIYIPVMKKLFEIKRVNYEDSFFVYGKPETYYWTLSIEMFKYSHETISTGVAEIDIIENNNTYIIDLYVNNGNGINYIINETIMQGEIQALVKEWNSSTSVLSVYNIFGGDFIRGEEIIGNTSNAHWTIVDYDPLEDSEEKRLYVNSDLQDEANLSIVTVETNPFGSI